MNYEDIQELVRKLATRIREKELDDDMSVDSYDVSSYLLDNDPPRKSNWNYLNGRSWSEKWVIAMSLGPWREKQTQDVMKNVLYNLNGRQLINLHSKDRLPFPRLSGDWQWKWTLRLADYLREEEMPDATFFTWLKKVDGGGLEARGILRCICDAWGNSKTIDYFIREALDLEVIPIDRHVSRVLARAGLASISQNDLISACKTIGIRPQRLARALFRARS